MKYDNFKPVKKEASIGPKKIFEDHISIHANSGSFSKDTLNEIEEITSFRRTEKRKKLVYVTSPNKQVDSDSDKKLIAPIGEPSESYISEANFTINLDSNHTKTEHEPLTSQHLINNGSTSFPLFKFLASKVSKLDMQEMEKLCVILEEIKDTLREDGIPVTPINVKDSDHSSKSSQSTKDNSYGKDEDEEGNISCTNKPY